jgi:hypothetical protein
MEGVGGEGDWVEFRLATEFNRTVMCSLLDGYLPGSVGTPPHHQVPLGKTSIRTPPPPITLPFWAVRALSPRVIAVPSRYRTSAQNKLPITEEIHEKPWGVFYAFNYRGRVDCWKHLTGQALQDAPRQGGGGQVP